MNITTIYCHENAYCHYVIRHFGKMK